MSAGNVRCSQCSNIRRQCARAFEHDRHVTVVGDQSGAGLEHPIAPPLLKPAKPARDRMPRHPRGRSRGSPAADLRAAGRRRRGGPSPGRSPRRLCISDGALCLIRLESRGSSRHSARRSIGAVWSSASRRTRDQASPVTFAVRIPNPT
jgi:hypothetical protein